MAYSSGCAAMDAWIYWLAVFADLGEGYPDHLWLSKACIRYLFTASSFLPETNHKDFEYSRQCNQGSFFVNWDMVTSFWVFLEVQKFFEHSKMDKEKMGGVSNLGKSRFPKTPGFAAHSHLPHAAASWNRGHPLQYYNTL